MDNYLVSANLEFKTNALGTVGDLLRLFDKLDAAVSGAQSKLGALTADLSKLSNGARGISSTTKALEGLGKVRLGTGVVSDIEKVTLASKELAASQQQGARAAREQAEAYRAMARTPQRALTPGTAALRQARGAAHGGGPDLMMAGMGAQMVGQEGTTFFGDALKQEMAVRHELSSLRQNNAVGDAQIAEARAAAEKITRDNPGVLLVSAVKSISEAFNITGDLKEAIAAAPAMARAAYFYENAPGEHKGDHSYASLQATELMQRHIDPTTHQVSVEAINAELSEQMRVYAATRGRAGPDQYLAAAKQSRAAGITGNDQYMHEDLPAVLAALGGSRTGTGQAAVFSQLITGKMTEAAAEALKKAGLLDQSTTWAGGKVQNIQDHLRGWRGVAENPIQWVRDEVYGANGALAHNHIDQNDKIAVSKFLSDFASRQTGLGFLSETVIGMPGIDKEAKKVRETPRDPLSILRQNDPEQQVREYKAAQNELMLSLGKEALGPAIEALKLLTAGIRDLAAWGKEHPNFAKDLTLIGGGLSLLATGAGQAATVLFLGAPLLKGVSALAGAMLPFAPGASAEIALATVAGIGAGSLFALGAAAIALPIAMNTAVKALGLINEQGAGGGGKGLQGGNAAPSGGAMPNQFGPLGDGVSSWWHGFSSGPSSAGPHPRDLRHPSSMIAPPAAAAQPIHVSLNVDGKKMAETTVMHLASAANRPPSGRTGFDNRMGPTFGGASYA